MSPRTPGGAANPRERLLAAALRLLAEAGPEALQARRLAAEVGMSTMALYTHFGGLPQLITEVIREGFLRFGRRLQKVPRGDDRSRTCSPSGWPTATGRWRTPSSTG